MSDAASVPPIHESAGAVASTPIQLVVSSLGRAVRLIETGQFPDDLTIDHLEQALFLLLPAEARYFRNERLANPAKLFMAERILVAMLNRALKEPGRPRVEANRPGGLDALLCRNGYPPLPPLRPGQMRVNSLALQLKGLGSRVGQRFIVW